MGGAVFILAAIWLTLRGIREIVTAWRQPIEEF